MSENPNEPIDAHEPQAPSAAAEPTDAVAPAPVEAAPVVAAPAATESAPQYATEPLPPTQPPGGPVPPAGVPGTPGAPAAPVPTPPNKRGLSFGLVAAVAVAALVGGAAGAGIYAVATSNTQQSVVDSARTPTNIIVNDTDNATAVTAVAAKAGPSVVTISVTSDTAGGSGSGVILSKDGYVLTNAHVATLSGATDSPVLQVQTSDGRLFNATLVGSDPIADLAVIKIEGDATFEPATFADSDKLNVGDLAVAIGAPLGLANTVTNGIVSALNRSITVASSAVPETEEPTAPGNGGDSGNGPFDFWEFDNGQGQSGATPSSTIALPVVQTDAAINPGNSGGALLDADGKIIGINVAIASTGSSNQSTAGSIGVGFAIPSNYAKRVAFELIKDGVATHGLLGASVSDVTDEATVTNDSPLGALVQSVEPGGAAEKAGLQKGDLITSFEGQPITGKTDLTAQVRVLAGGSTAELTYVRDGKSHTAEVTLGTLK